MDEHRCVVVACSHMEDRKSLIHILESLSLDVISCSDMDQVHKVLSRRNVPLVFCDEQLSEGCFRDLVSADIPGQKASRVVVTIRTGDCDEYLRVMRLGAYDGLRCPLCPTDVELVVLRAMREDQISYRKTA
jgi:DNA-binding NtrC family response regulator